MMITSGTIRLNNKGQAMVEMALVIGFLVLLIFGMTEFGRAMYTKNTLNSAARAGARTAIVTPSITDTGAITSTGPVQLQCPYSGTCTANNCVYQTVCNSIVAGVASPIYVSVQIFDPTGTTSGQTPSTGNQVRVTVEAPFTPVLAFMRNMISAQLSGQATMRYE